MTEPTRLPPYDREPVTSGDLPVVGWWGRGLVAKRCHCGRPITDASSCGCCCCECDHPEEIA